MISAAMLEVRLAALVSPVKAVVPADEKGDDSNPQRRFAVRLVYVRVGILAQSLVAHNVKRRDGKHDDQQLVENLIADEQRQP